MARDGRGLGAGPWRHGKGAVRALSGDGPARHVTARHGRARQGKAGHDKASEGKTKKPMQGKSRQGKAMEEKAKDGKTRQDRAREGEGRQCKAWVGEARHGRTRQGKAKECKRRHMAPMYTNSDRISQGENTLDISDPFQKTISLKNEGRTSMGPQPMSNLSSLLLGAIDVDWKPITGRLD